MLWDCLPCCWPYVGLEDLPDKIPARAVCAGAPPETLRAVLTAGTAVLLACTVVYGCVMEGFYAKKRV